MSMKHDLSKFRNTFVKETSEDIQEAMRGNTSAPKIGSGLHEVVVTKMYTNKAGETSKITDRAGGSLSFNFIVRNSARQEQLINMFVPLALSFSQVCKSKDNKGDSFLFNKSVKLLMSMRIDPALFREAVMFTDGEAISLLVGAQFVLENFWPIKSVHLEWDSTAKAHFFCNAMGEKFPSGEMSGPHYVENTANPKDRFKPFLSIAYQNGYSFSEQFNTEFHEHPTVGNEKVSSDLLVACKPKVEAPVKEFKIVNKTVPPVFPSVVAPLVKKIISPLDVEPDLESE